MLLDVWSSDGRTDRAADPVLTQWNRFLHDCIIYHHFYRSMGESVQAFSSDHRNSNRNYRITDLWTDRIYAASIGDRFRSFNLLE